ncbi:MAG: hypothetical protein LBR90_02730, partial [Elusimicrobiota bacterium]|nr:hypothetical protein [Elusimicrobiota bacterium]
MNLFTGHAGALKDAFYGFIKEHKKNHFDKALVVLPGGRLQSVLKREAAQKLGVIANIYFTDFLSLALEVNAAAGDVKPLLPDTYRQDFIIKNILRRRGAAHARGYVRALKAALRDLINAQVTPQILRDIKEENFDPEAKEQLTQLAGLYEDYLAAIKDPRFNTYAQTLQNAAQNAGQSAYLKSFGHIIFYGFYD